VIKKKEHLKRRKLHGFRGTSDGRIKSKRSALRSRKGKKEPSHISRQNLGGGVGAGGRKKAGKGSAVRQKEERQIGKADQLCGEKKKPSALREKETKQVRWSQQGKSRTRPPEKNIGDERRIEDSKRRPVRRGKSLRKIGFWKKDRRRKRSGREKERQSGRPHRCRREGGEGGGTVRASAERGPRSR